MIQVPAAPWAHLAFDLTAWGGGIALSLVLHRWRLKALAETVARKVGGGYFAALAGGAIPGAWLVGSLNSLRGAHPALSHSVAGALVCAIVGVELYKRLRGVTGSTGGVFVGPFALGVVIGRLGYFFAGLPDGTYGSPTTLPWAVDPGDRMPVVVGGLPTLLGFVVMRSDGRWRRRLKPKPPPSAPPPG